MAVVTKCYGNGKSTKQRKYLQLTKPMIWSTPSSAEDCCICMTETRGFTAATKAKISYANVSSVVKPDKIRHLDVAVASGSMDVDRHSEEEVMEVDESSDEESSDDDGYLPDNERKAPQPFTQEALMTL